MTEKKAYKDYSAGQRVAARVVDMHEKEVSVIVDDTVPGILRATFPINFAVEPPRHLLPGDTITLIVKQQDHRQRRLVLALDDEYAVRLGEADVTQIAQETRRALTLRPSPQTLAIEGNHPLDDDLFLDFDSRLVVHGSHSQPHMLEGDLDNPADMLYQQIDEKDLDDDESDEHDDED